MGDLVQKTFRYIMRPYFQLIAVLAIILTGVIVYEVVTNTNFFDNGALVRATGIVRQSQLSVPPVRPRASGGGSAPTVPGSDHIIWKYIDSQAIPTSVSFGNNSTRVLATSFGVLNGQVGTFVKLFSTAAPTDPDNPPTIWSFFTLDSYNIHGAASPTTDTYAVFQDVRLGTNNYRTPQLSVYLSASATPLFTYAFNVQVPLGNTITDYHFLKISNAGKIVAGMKDPTTGSQNFYAAVFQPGSQTPTTATLSVSGNIGKAVDLSEDGSTALLTTTNGYDTYVVKLNPISIIQDITWSQFEYVYCNSISANADKFVIGGFFKLRVNTWTGTNYTAGPDRPFTGDLSRCDGADLSSDGSMLAFDHALPNQPTHFSNTAFQAESLNLSTNTSGVQTVFTGIGPEYDQVQDVTITPNGQLFAVASTGSIPPTVSQVQVYSTQSPIQNAPVFEALLSGGATDVETSPNGLLLAVGNRRYTDTSPTSDGAFTLYSLTNLNGLPTPATELAGAADSTKKIHVWWNNGVNATQYEVYFTSTTNAPCPAGVTPVNVGNATAWTFTNLQRFTRYYLSIKALNAQGESPCSAVVKIRTLQNDPVLGIMLPPGPPTNLTLSNILFGALNLVWVPPVTPPNGNAPTGYHIWRQTVPNVLTTGTPAFTLNSGAANSFNDTTVVAGNTYYYRVTAFDVGGDSLPSNEGSSTPNFPNCLNGTFNSTNQQCELTFNVGFDDSIGINSFNWVSALSAVTGQVNLNQTYLSVQQFPGGIIQNGFYTFDTSAIPDSVTLTSASFKELIRSAYVSGSPPAADREVYLLKAINSTPPANGQLIGSDYPKCGYNQTDPIAVKPILANTLDAATVPNNAFSTLTLNAFGQAFINKTGYTKLCQSTSEAWSGIPTASGNGTYFFVTGKEGAAGQQATLTVGWNP